MKGNKELYPNLRAKALFECSRHGEVKPYHKQTSAAIMFFRYVYRTILILFSIMFIASLWELVTGLLITSGNHNQFLTARTSIFMLVLSGTLFMLNNQILLVLGHGFKDKTAQLYVDRLSSIEDCIANLKTISAMYLFTFVVSIVGLWAMWGAYGTPLYHGLIGEQVNALSSVIEVMGQQQTTPYFEGFTKESTSFKPFYLVATICFIITLALSVLGYANSKIIRVKLMTY